MKSPEGFTPPQAKIEKNEKEIAQKSPEIEIVEIGDEQLKRHSKLVLGFQREDLREVIQRARGKENVRYTSPDGKEFFTKYVNQQEGKRDNIEGLINEKHILDLLADSGVTPKNSELKIYPNKKRARLVIEQVPGVSLDHLDENQSAKFLNEGAEKTIYSTADALYKIHQKGVLLVDINEGTFLLDKHDDKIETRLVDFELAVYLNNSKPEDREAAFWWYSGKDIGLRLNKQLDHQNPDVLKKSEVNLWARTLAGRMIGFSDMSASVDLPPEKQAEFDAMKSRIIPILEKQIKERAKKDYEYEFQIPKEDRFYELPTEDNFIQKELEREIPRQTNEELLGILLEEKLKAKGIIVSKEAVNFMSRALSPELQNRPSDFKELKK